MSVGTEDDAALLGERERLRRSEQEVRVAGTVRTSQQVIVLIEHGHVPVLREALTDAVLAKESRVDVCGIVYELTRLGCCLHLGPVLCVREGPVLGQPSERTRHITLLGVLPRLLRGEGLSLSLVLHMVRPFGAGLLL